MVGLSGYVTYVLLYSSQAIANGALAIDSNQGDQYGFAYDYPSMSEARSRALQECGRGCRIVMEFSRGCAAYAADQSSGSTAYGWAKDFSNSSEAKNRVIDECRSRGGSQCMARVWGCNSK